VAAEDVYSAGVGEWQLKKRGVQKKRNTTLLLCRFVVGCRLFSALPCAFFQKTGQVGDSETFGVGKSGTKQKVRAKNPGKP